MFLFISRYIIRCALASVEQTNKLTSCELIDKNHPRKFQLMFMGLQYVAWFCRQSSYIRKFIWCTLFSQCHFSFMLVRRCVACSDVAKRLQCFFVWSLKWPKAPAIDSIQWNGIWTFVFYVSEFKLFKKALFVTIGMAMSVSPPRWSRVKYLNNYLSHKIILL